MQEGDELFRVAGIFAALAIALHNIPSYLRADLLCHGKTGEGVSAMGVSLVLLSQEVRFRFAACQRMVEFLTGIWRSGG
jgi:hypothetical protein